MSQYLTIGVASPRLGFPEHQVRAAVSRLTGLPGVIRLGRYFGFDPARLTELREELLRHGLVPAARDEAVAQ